MSSWIWLSIGLGIGNFLYAAFRDRAWVQAFGIFMAQNVALIAAYFAKPWEG